MLPSRPDETKPKPAELTLYFEAKLMPTSGRNKITRNEHNSSQEWRKNMKRCTFWNIKTKCT